MARMKLYSIALPVRDNDGNLYHFAHARWQQCALFLAGGYTEFPPAHGNWRNPASGQVYREEMIEYRVATTAPIWEKLVAIAFSEFFDQLALFTAEIGEANIRNRD
jgi:hypothetical protein